MIKMFEKAGYPPNAVEVEAFQRALPMLATIERLIVSAQKRLDRFLKELEKAIRGTAEALRLATAKATAAVGPPIRRRTRKARAWHRNGKSLQTGATPLRVAARRLTRQGAFANERASPRLGNSDDK